MKLRSPLALVLLLALCGVALKRDVWDHVGRVIHRLREAPILEDAAISQTFLLSDDGWLKFRLPQRGNIVRVLTTASVLRPIPEVDATSARPGWRYSLQYRVVDSAGKVLREAPFHFRTHVTEYELPESTQRITSSFFEDRQRVPAITRRLLVPLDTLNGKHHELHLRLVKKEAALDDVAARVACHTQRHHYDRLGLWQKINAERKERICSASIYPPELMSLEQRRAVLRWQWKPLAPTGLEGRDYQRREMYTREEIEGREADVDFLPSGMILHATRRGVIPLPELPGAVKLAVERISNVQGQEPLATAPSTGEQRPLVPSSATTADSKQGPRIVARWFDRHIPQWREQVWELSAVRQEFDVPFAGGMLEIESTHPIAMTASWQREDGGESVDITPQATLVRVYPCRPQSPLHYRIAHTGALATPLRVAFRCVDARPNETKSSNTTVVDDLPETIDVRWQYLDHEGQAVGGGNAPFAAEPSAYDYIDEGETETAISNATFYHWCVPPKAAVIRFESADERVCISASTRPPQLATTTFVPSPLGFEESEASEFRNWFPLRPEEHVTLVKSRDSQVVKTQPRPPEHDPRILAGNYEWEDFQPQGFWQGRYLIEPRESDAPVREEALDNTFFAVPTGEELPVRILSEHGGPIDLFVIFVDDGHARRETSVSPNPFSPLSVFLDGQQRGTHSLRGGRGELLVRDVSPGDHLLKIHAPQNVRVLVNRIDAGGQTLFIKRLAVRFDGTDLTFDVEKRSPSRELLVLDYYYDLTETPSPVVLEAEIVSPNGMPGAEPTANPLLSWAATRRVFHLEPPALGSDTKGFLLATADETVSPARRCFVTLGENLAVGNYQLRIKGSPQQRAYVIVSRTTPGPYELRKMIRQPWAGFVTTLTQ